MNRTRNYDAAEGAEGEPSGSGGGGENTGDAFTVKRIMGRTPGLIKSKFLSVLDSSNGILNGISNKVYTKHFHISGKTHSPVTEIFCFAFF